MSGESPPTPGHDALQAVFADRAFIDSLRVPPAPIGEGP
jgi:hypothetical protein